jgi:hypothetical protein
MGIRHPNGVDFLSRDKTKDFQRSSYEQLSEFFFIKIWVISFFLINLGMKHEDNEHVTVDKDHILLVD